MRPKGTLILLSLALMLIVPNLAMARAVHNFNCTNCHKAGVTLAADLGAVLCLECHGDSPNPIPLVETGVPTSPIETFSGGDASDEMNNNPLPSSEVSHNWAASSTNPAAGAQEPSAVNYPGFFKRYNPTRGKVACSRCHEIHGDLASNPKLLRLEDRYATSAPLTADEMCRACHVTFNVGPGSNGMLTHPLLNSAELANVETDPGKNANYTDMSGTLPAYDPATSFSTPINLVAGGVGCISCHSPHFADSNSMTVDGPLETLAQGDGHMLRSDGPRDLTAVTEADFTLAEAQKKSTLCQTCHEYLVHGKVDDGAADRFLGCLDCHSGHAYNGNDPYFFVLRKDSYNPIDDAPVSFTGYSFSGFDYIYNNVAIFGLLNRTEVWKDNSNLTSLGYCEACHGEAESIPKGAQSHSSTDDCAACHQHHGSGWTYSFQNDASAATCGDCHGFPPYVNSRGDRTAGGVDGGFAYMSDSWRYDHASVTYYKDESATPHNAHAAGGTAQGAASDYIFGNGVYACEPCHENYVPTHQEESTTPYATGFRDVNFYPGVDLSTTATYNSSTGECSALYCHSNGAPRTADGPTRNYAAGTLTTPSWDGGKDQIIGQPGRCGTCHGNTSVTMASSNNTPAHGKHLDQYGNDCSICHSETAADNSSLASGANLVNILSPAAGGKHVNTQYDVVYRTSGSTLYTALGVNDNGVDYDPVTGTCSVYCHDPADLGNTADWDDGVGGAACGSCHGVTAATLTTNSHAVHIDSAGANISCDDCHGAGASTAAHAGHVDGVPTTLSVASSCDVCHGVENSAAWDISPVWGNPASADCRTCHTGAVVTDYNAGAVIAPDKSLASSLGHNLTSGNYAVTGNPAANKECTACHLSSINGEADHVGGVVSKLLVGGFSCEDCHTSAGSRNAEATVDVQTHSNMDADYTGQKRADFSKLCLACHDPHGAGSNIAMIAQVKTDFAGAVVFTSTAGADSFDELDADNIDDICATCHTTTAHNNLAVAGAHKEGDNCLTCHGHTEANAYGGFMPQGGTACNDCHGNPPTASDDRPAGKAGVHEMHVDVSSHEESEDKFDCEVCHPGASTFTLSHADSSVSLAGGITNTTCANACHYSGGDDGNWTDSDGLNCSSCHYWSDSPSSAGNVANGNSEAVSATHNKHFDSGKGCTNCHADNSTDNSFPRTHIDDHEAWDLNVTNDGTVLDDRGNALQDEATVTVTTWDDGTDTCSNAACHNPSGLSNAATWGTPNSQNCDFCHSSTNPDTGKGTPGSHGVHMGATGTFGLTVACTSCHPDNTGVNGHLTGVVDLNGGFVYNASLSDYTDTTYGRCTTTVCHNDGKGAAVQSPIWGTPSPNCSICHALPPGTGRHAGHVGNSNYIAGCGDCHLDATNTVMAVSTHIDTTIQAGDASIDLVSTDGVNCANACHDVDATGTWTDSNPLDCIECHTAGKIGTAPISGLHSGTLTVSGNTHDVSFQVTRGEAVPSGSCTTCHTGIDVGNNLPAAHIAGGAPSATQAAMSADINYNNGAPSTCAPVNGLASCHDDGGAWSRKWSTTAQNSDDTECANCHGDFDRGWVTGVIARHAGDAQVEAGHDGIDKCYMCHTYKKGVTVPYDFSAKHRDGTIQLNDDMLFVDNNDSTNTCNGCHDSGGTGPYGTGDGEYGFIDTNKDDTADGGANRWSREMVAGGPAGNCNGCHVTYGRDHTGPNESEAVHTYHTGSPMSPGCGACHPADSGPGGALHENNIVDFGGTYLTSALNYSGADFGNTNCSSANGCHDSDEGSWVADSLATCADCHSATGKLLDQGGYPPTSNAHGAHLANAAYVGTVDVDACDACHGATSSVVNHLSTHNDGNVTVINDITAYTLISEAGDGTCTNNCHTVVSGRDWNDATALACADCHAAAKMLPSLDAWPVSSAKHTVHIDNNTYVPGDCSDCHGTDAATGAHVNHKDGAVNNTVTYVSGTQTCSISCHLADTTGDWTAGGALVCRDCHTGTYVGGNGNLPASGLHAITPTISAATHDDTLASGNCINCHDAASPSNAHKTGTLNSSSTATFTFNANVSSYAAATGCNASCHADSGAWARKWSITAANSDGTECGNCHGTFATGFTAGVVARHQNTSNGDADGQVASSHDGTDPCYTCHTYKAGDATFYNFATQHRDNNIQINNQISFVDNGSTVGCSACHAANDGTADEGHEFADTTSRWTRIPQNGPSADCTDCHNSNGRTHSGANESATIHALHEGSSLFAGSCEACHADSRPGGVNHFNNTVDFGGTYLTTALDYSGADFTNINCSTANGCHDSDDNEWAGATLGGDSCTDCHASGVKLLSQNNMFPPNGNKHTIHINQNTYVPGDCADCHGASADTGAHATHRNGTVNDSVSYDGGTATCTNTCHIADTTDDWTTGSLACTDCHGSSASGKSLDAGGEADMSVSVGPNAGEHDIHMANASFVGGGCADCHGHDGALGAVDGHLDGPDLATITVAGSLASYNTGNGTCSNACHYTVAGYGWTDSMGLNCADCHNATVLAGAARTLDQGGWPVSSAKHTAHIDNDTYVPADCSDCHGASAATGAHSGHKNGSVENSVSYVSGTQTCTVTCHVASTAGDWTAGGSLACRDCHDSGSYVGSGYLPASGLHAITPTVSSATHDDTLQSGNCINCHDSASPSSLHKDGTLQSSAGATFTFHSNVSSYVAGTGCNASCHSDSGDWARKWSTSAANSDGSECSNCHGGIGVGYTAAGWVSGIVPDHLNNWDGDGNGPEVMTSHSECKSCHGFNGPADKDDNYNVAAMHRNDQITMNGGTSYNEANWGCDNAGCHGDASAAHGMADSGWTVELGSFEAGGDCWTCHGDSATGQIYPDGTGGTPGYVDDRGVGAHVEHLLAIVDRLDDDTMNHSATMESIKDNTVACSYCHPDPGGTGHSTDSGDLRVDLLTSGQFKYLIDGTPNGTGIFNYDSDGTCSTIKCHARAPYTPGWWTDSQAPGNITAGASNLAISAGPEPRSLKITWDAPGDDGYVDGTAYRYDIRMGSDGDARYPAASEATNFTRSDNFFGGPPTVGRKGDLQEAIARNLIPGVSYSFAMRTYDEAGNLGTSDVVSMTVPADTAAPVLVGSPEWYGLDRTTVLDNSGSVYLEWTQAEDHSMPITYDIFWSDVGSIDYGSPQASTKDQHGYRVSGLSDGIPYTFAVRAKDSAGNSDTNLSTLLAAPEGLKDVPKTDLTYYASGAVSGGSVNMLTTDFTTTTASSAAAYPVVFVTPKVYSGDTVIYASAMTLFIDNNNVASDLTCELGLWNGSSFQSFAAGNGGALVSTPVTVGKRTIRSVKFSFNGASRTVFAGEQLAVRFNVNTDTIDSVAWGSTTNRGDLVFAEKPLNTSPTTPSANASVSGKDVSIWWAASTDTADAVADTVHYDVYGDDGSGSFAHLIATNLASNKTSGSPLIWDTQKAGIALTSGNSNVQVRVEAGDSLAGTGTLSHTSSTVSGLVVDNSGDNDPPGQITNFAAETRPKQGSIYLHWTAPGDDGDNNGRAAYYDIRWSDTEILDDAAFNSATPLDAEPFPTFGGTNQGMEVLGLTEGVDYYFGIKTVDDGGNVSPLSTTSPNALGGPRCGICHSTPPDETATRGNHTQHGYTLNDCSNCHGNDPGTGAQTFQLDHQDGQVLLGWKTATPSAGTYNGYEITYTQGGQTIYQDSSGGGVNLVIGDPNDAIDNGTCFSWSSLNVSGCHGPAASVPWQAGQTLECSACHGDNTRTVDLYDHPYDDHSEDISASPPVDNHGYDGTGATVVERKYVGAHEKHLNYSFRLSKGDSCRLCHQGNNHADGIIDVSLDLAAAGPDATWAGGADDTEFGSCGSMSAESCHPYTAAPDWDSQLEFECINCHGMGGTVPGHVTDPSEGLTDTSGDGLGGDDTGIPGNCDWCHVAGHPQERDLVGVENAVNPVVTTVDSHYLTTGEKVTIHTQSGMTEINNYTTTVTVLNATQFSLDATDTSGYGVWDTGTFIQGNGWGIVLIPNNSLVGINYKSGGIHLKAQIGSHGLAQSEAQQCWSCHDANGISEWRTDDGSDNNTDPGNGTDYDYGQTYSDSPGGAATTAWIVNGQGAWWRSGAVLSGAHTGFTYKDGRIQSTHSTNPAGTAALSGSDYNYSESVDAINTIICSNCHDVHDMNMAKNDTADGQPYLRGTWKRNPYKEDGAPRSGTSYTAAATGQPGYGYGAVPRASSSVTQQMGGYWIDQNSGNPTAGWTYSSSAGLCILCHGDNVDILNQFDTGQGESNLWLADNNGHANAAVGGTGLGAANIFRTGFDGTYGFGRQGTGGTDEANPNPGGWMAFQNTQATAKTGDDDWGYGPRSAKGPYIDPLQVSQVTTPALIFAWGVAVEPDTVEIGVHQFSCSKCHNPHASRLPKLMITNCLDVTHNTWDNDWSGDSTWSSFNGTTSSWGTNRISHLSTAQNCHRYVDVNGDNNPDEQGWNKVTPW